MHDLLSRLQRVKMILTCLVLVIIGASLIALDQQLSSWRTWHGLTYVPFAELGGILIGAGLLSIWINRLFRREQDASDDLRLRTLLDEQAPTMRDAVLDAFAANQEDLARVANPETLDQIIRNSLALRLGDEQFAAEVYDDIRDQAIKASERWHDASLSIDLAPLPGDTAGKFFAVTVRWEYTVVPAYAERRFVCLSDRSEYIELAHERGATSPWFIKPGVGVEAGDREAYELLQFAVNGEPRTIRRTARKHGQVYTASIGNDHVKAAEPVTVAYTFRTVTTRAGHLLFFEIPVPTRDMSVTFDYSGCNIASVSALDLVPSVRPTRIERSPADTPESIRVELDGWVFPRSGVAFVWTLEDDLHRPAIVQPAR